MSRLTTFLRMNPVALFLRRRTIRDRIRSIFGHRGWIIDRTQAFEAATLYGLAKWRFWRNSRGRTPTVYIVGLFGTGRTYINAIIETHFYERASDFRDGLEHESTPTSMIYSGHMTLKYSSSEQQPPDFGNRIVESVRSGAGRLILIYRHPLDSLLANWVWWRSFLLGRDLGASISSSFQSLEQLAEFIDREWSSLEAFALGDASFYGSSGYRFLSFSEFVEESVLLFDQASLRLRFEELKVNPYKAFVRLVDVISPEMRVSPSLHIQRPNAKPGAYLFVMKTVPRFEAFVNRLSPETKLRMAKLGYRC
jgi:hypothetical protein